MAATYCMLQINFEIQLKLASNWLKTKLTRCAVKKSPDLALDPWTGI